MKIIDIIKLIRKKCKTVTSLIILTAIILSGTCYASPTEETKSNTSTSKINPQRVITDQINTMDFKSINESYLKETDNDILKNLNFESQVREIAQGKTSATKGIFYKLKESALNQLTKEVKENMIMFSKLLILILLCAILKNIQDSFSSNVGEIAFYACYILMVLLLIGSFKIVMDMARDTVSAMVDFMVAIVPLLISILGVSGMPSSAAVLSPSVMVVVSFVDIIIKDVMLPMIFLYAVLKIINNISLETKISNLCDLMKKVVEWSMGIMFTIFVAVMTVQGVATSSFDGVAGKTAKFALGNFIPVVGGMLSDALDSVLSCSILIKNSISVVGIIVIIVIISIPLIKLLVIMFMYKLGAAIAQPIADGRMVSCLNDVGTAVTLVFVSVFAASFVFMICLSIIITISSAAVHI